jgi:hypothetical protein
MAIRTRSPISVITLIGDLLTMKSTAIIDVLAVLHLA